MVILLLTARSQPLCIEASRRRGRQTLIRNPHYASMSTCIWQQHDTMAYCPVQYLQYSTVQHGTVAAIHCTQREGSARRCWLPPALALSLSSWSTYRT